MYFLWIGGASRPLWLHIILCVQCLFVWLHLQGYKYCLPINSRQYCFWNFPEGLLKFFFVLWASSQMHICFPTMQRRRGAAFFPFGELIFLETPASRPSPLSCTYDFLLSCARLSSLLPVCRNFFPFSPGFWLADVHWCGHGWFLFKTLLARFQLVAEKFVILKIEIKAWTKA